MIIHAQSTHTLHASKVAPFSFDYHEQDFVTTDLRNFDATQYTSFYEVRNWDKEGVLFFYLARHKNGQWHVWYKGLKMWTSFGTTMQKAIDGAQRDGWLYA